MESRAAERPKTEVGGMLFGAFEKEDGKVVNVQVERVVNVPDDQGIHQSAYFSIDDGFMNEVVDEYIPPYTYLGNWHSHLGYGGPSSGDHKQVTKFFKQNPDRDYLIAVIQDRDGSPRDPSYDTYIELYERKHDGSFEYTIHSVTGIKTIEHPPERTVDEDAKSESDDGLLDRVKSDLNSLELNEGLSSDVLDLSTEIINQVDQVDENGVGTVYQNPGEDPETILLLPVEIRLESQEDEAGSKIEQAKDEITKTLSLTAGHSVDDSEPTGLLSAFLSISIPGEYPEGEIFVDVKSRDQTFQATVMQESSTKLSASPREFRNQLQTMLETDAHDFLAQSVGQLLATRGGGE